VSGREDFGERLRRELAERRGGVDPSDRDDQPTPEQARVVRANQELRRMVDRARSRNRVVRTLW